MIADKLDDPDAAPSFSGTLLNAADVAPKVVALLDRPRAVLAIPRWRGWFVRAFATLPQRRPARDPAVHGGRAAQAEALEEAHRIRGNALS